MQDLYDPEAPKKPTNVSVNRDLLAKSRDLGINLSAALERALREQLTEAQAEEWSEENQAAIQAYNEFVEQHGCFGEEFRSF